MKRLTLFITLLVLAACSIDRFPLPNTGGSGGFGASDTVFLKLNRSIDLPSGATPSDLFIDDDGHIYVAESGSGRISVFDQALNELTDVGLDDFHVPGVRGVCVGPEQVLFAVSGDSSLWSLNLQANRETIQFAFDGATVQLKSGGDPQHISVVEFADLVESGEIRDWDVVEVDELDIESNDFLDRLRPRVLFNRSSAFLNAVAKGRAGHRELFLANNNRTTNRIERLRLVPSTVLVTENPEVPFVYLYDLLQREQGGDSTEVVITAGTGRANADSLLSLDMDLNGRLYYTQFAPSVGYFKAQRLDVETVGGKDYWSFDFTLSGKDIMDAGRFDNPVDITWTSSNMYVVERRPAPEGGVSTHHVQVFKTGGDFLLPLGATRTFVDTTFQVDETVVDSVYKSWDFDQLNDPRSVAVYGNRSDRAGNSDEIVFVADEDRILMFTLSVSEDDLPVQ
jgi:hypothetical protein